VTGLTAKSAHRKDPTGHLHSTREKPDYPETTPVFDAPSSRGIDIAFTLGDQEEGA
jgi:hypothetical protein